MVARISEMKKQNPKADVSTLENELNRMIYKLYDFTEEEIKIIENKVV